MMITPIGKRTLEEIKAYARSITNDCFLIQDLYDDVRERLEGESDDDLAIILGCGEGSQTIKTYAEERGLQERYL